MSAEWARMRLTDRITVRVRGNAEAVAVTVQAALSPWCRRRFIAVERPDGLTRYVNPYAVLYIEPWPEEDAE